MAGSYGTLREARFYDRLSMLNGRSRDVGIRSSGRRHTDAPCALCALLGRGAATMVGEDHCCKQGTESPGRRLQLYTGVSAMRRSKPQPIRNKLDLTDRTQVRLVRKRLGLSDAELTSIVERTGNSIAAISKEAALQRATTLPKPDDVPPAAVIASATVGEQATTEVTAIPPNS